jgi:hypothetical protein
MSSAGQAHPALAASDLAGLWIAGRIGPPLTRQWRNIDLSQNYWLQLVFKSPHLQADGHVAERLTGSRSQKTF